MPARPPGRPAGIFVLVLLVAAGGCERSEGRADEGPRVLELDSARIPLPDSVRLRVVSLDRALPEDLAPASLTIRVDDIVRFEAADAAAHAIAFDGQGLSAESRRFLEVTGQMRSPPLVGKGRAWVVSFAHAPPGDYPYRCATHDATGRIAVRAR